MDLGEDDDVPSARLRLAGLIVLALAVGFGSWFVVRRWTSTEDATGEPLSAPSTSSIAVSSPAASSSSTSATEPAPTPTDSTPQPTSTVAAVTSTTGAAASSLPDGSPVPIEIVFDGDSVTLDGEVPDEASSDRLEQLARDHARDSSANVTNELTVNQGVPNNVGVRFLDLQFVQFPVAGSELLPEHASDLDRIVTIMDELPTISIVVVGHADDPGSEPFSVVAAERARSAARYLTDAGIVPSRVSSRGAGLADLRTLVDDAVVRALSRRTEFVFFGVLVS